LTAPSSSADATGLQVLPIEAATLSAAARAFNLQLARIDKLKSQLDELQALGQAHRAEQHRWVAPLQAQHTQLLREQVLALDERLQGKSLSRLQRETAVEVLCDLAEQLVDEAQDRGASDMAANMRALHDRHSRRTLEQKKKDAAAALRARLEAALGQPLSDAPEEASMQELLRAGMQKLRESVGEEQAQKRAAAQARKARKKPGAAQLEAQAQQTDADTLLRTLFRQLASALHPDREADPAQRLQKNALMSEANAAYGRKDLVTLMQIQLRAALVDAGAVARMADDKLAALTVLLKQQVADLERERAARQRQLAAEFELPGGAAPNANTLKQLLLTQVQSRERDVQQAERDLAQLRDDAGVKRWLNAQRQQAPQRLADRDLDDFW
jgi:hypothetical protein